MAQNLLDAFAEAHGLSDERIAVEMQGRVPRCSAGYIRMIRRGDKTPGYPLARALVEWMREIDPQSSATADALMGLAAKVDAA